MANAATDETPTGPEPHVAVSDQQDLISLSSQRIVDLVRLVLRGENDRHDVSVALVDDAAIAELHERWLGVPGPTDVIAFPLLAEGDADLLLGEVVVSSDTAMRQATERGHPPERELLLYVVHGVLHLLGYDDHDPEDRQRMHQRQEQLLEEFLDR